MAYKQQKFIPSVMQAGSLRPGCQCGWVRASRGLQMSHMAEGSRELCEISVTTAPIPSWGPYLCALSTSQRAAPNTITLGNRVSAQECWGDTNTQTIAAAFSRVLHIITVLMPLPINIIVSFLNLYLLIGFFLLIMIICSYFFACLIIFKY